ncbi:hypothetical protein A28LD_2310 [Idiomarina sp. A28L]|uniref:hypothetical protein n=1 Tax=Idiomarina sp. A28L TaxID=1036674 RepID=UPI00021385F1|nr:hypothetical protein [Idiomarina sp. A28L]EGN74218.1 hypothetical protein A28LD_2310 [Idiomarina sp. A28L]
MNDNESNNKGILNLNVFLHSIKASGIQLIWPIGGIGIPAIYFGFEGNWLEMLLLFIVCFVSIQFFYLISCILVTKVKLSDKEAALQYSSLTDEEKGKYIADTLIGW